MVLGAGAVSWLSAFKTGGVAGRVLVSADCARCRKLAAQAAYILVPASRMSTGRGILPSYLGLCWCNLFYGGRMYGGSDSQVVFMTFLVWCSHFAAGRTGYEV